MTEHEIIESQNETIKRLKEQLEWQQIHYDQLRTMHNNYWREAETKIRSLIGSWLE